MRPLKVATYNIHRCIGVDGRYQPFRIAQVLRDLQADIIGLQEVDTSLLQTNGLHQLEFLAQETAFESVEGLVLKRETGLYGNALLTRFPVIAVRRIDLSVRGMPEPRGALDVDLLVDGEKLRVIVTHLGLVFWERRYQILRLLQAIGPNANEKVILMGDFNLLSTFLPRLRPLHRRLGHPPKVRTYPSRVPLFPLDRIWVQPMTALQNLAAFSTPETKLASDHLPLAATLTFPS